MVERILYLAFNIFLAIQISSQENCNSPLGLEDRRIPDSSFSASSQHNRHGASNARLNNDKKAKVWLAAKNVANEYVQVDLGEIYVLTGVATQGRTKSGYEQYISKYYVGYSSDGKNFQTLKDKLGNLVIFEGKLKASKNELPSINARYFRLYAQKWVRKVCTQLELYGCRPRNCSINNGGCSERCVQLDNGHVICGCNKPGYELVNGKCQDIDECSNYHLCDHNCENTDGSYKCSCKSGYNLSGNGKSCKDINECQGNHTCDQICVNIPGSYKCMCKRGYKFGSGSLSKKCIDVDECMAGTSGCEHMCNNTVGSFKCSCRHGYKLDYDRKSCTDINECRLDTDKCDQICLNHVGGYTCKCRQGHSLADDGFGCDDINECKMNNGGCSDNCTNTFGSFFCTCPKGFKLKLDDRTCEDVDECQNDYGNCEHICVNEVGKHRCECRAGYRLLSDGYRCEDIDECAEKSPCDATSMNCVNTKPSYRCDCKQGFEPKIGNPAACQRVKCSAFPVDPKFTVEPPRCLLSDTNAFGDVCTFKCASGYEPADPNNMKATCLATRQWSVTLPQCNGVKCPAVSQPSNGKLAPAECAYGIRYPGTCSIRCNSGYSNVGPSKVSCQSDGSFNSDVTKLGCRGETTTPVISCPPGIVAELPKGSKSMIVASQWKYPYTNVGTITSSHDINFEFPVGITTVTFTTTTKDGQSDSCTIRVTILDKEEPKVVYCPKDQYVKKNPGTLVTWPEPQFSDNVGVVKVEASPYQPGVDLNENDYHIVYVAKDKAGNHATCEFDLFVTEKKCSEHDFSVDSTTTNKQCSSIPGGTYFCYPNCKTGRIFAAAQQSPWYTCMSGIWSPPVENVPDCVGFSKFVDKCPEGTSELSDPVAGKVCANCPAGTYYNGTCEKCPVGYYQDKEKQLSCKKCSASQGTTEIGAKQCKNLCTPGTYSPSGFPTETDSCKLCSIGEYEPNYGSKSCEKCTGNTTTLILGETSKKECGRKGMITIAPKGETTVTEGEDVELICRSSALPSFSISWTKVNPVDDVYGGKVIQKDLYANGKLSGKSYRISQVTYHDRGVYLCKTTNPFGTVQQCVTLNVLKNLG
ncbi:sushi, von Willebrand factor type A, EGF and pentraxin domain-containing protein 1-like isoform X2 [Dendronephthya gigantea]|uniref:sushi, von Willebrand factor type A, EGF and pentraxin domain-containing protein 1-like isoform X2 n=1 Tax=Dendronephthya gigantea TaxID=151771 RepID=UPI00106D1CFD|nr:sushi, von Willebrand factor type A, EGF and pentraxin domain-containing protein 1-like isoform X2 [Dendronephthya gigantea]